MGRRSFSELGTAVAGLALLALILTGPALVGHAALGPDQALDWDPLFRKGLPPPLPSNTSDYSPIVLDFPGDLAFARGVRAGRLDSWNPLVGAGAPLWAEHSGPFFPIKIPFYAVPSRATYNLFLVLRLFAAGLGAYLLARRRGLAPAAAIGAGATFELSGPLLAALPSGNSSAPFMLPWAILGSFAIARDRSWRSAAGTGIVLGITGCSGHPTLILMVFAAFAAASVGHLVSSWRNPRVAFRVGVRTVFAIVLGLALAAPSLLPLGELTNLGSTYKSRPVATVTRNFNLHESRQSFWAAFLHYDVLSPPLGHAAGVPFRLPLVAPAAIAVLIGVLARRMTAALVCVALLGIALTLAPTLLVWMYRAPGLDLILPTYAWSLVALPLTQLLGDGIEAITALISRGRGLIAAALAALIIFGRLLAVAPSVLQPASAVLEGPPSPAVQFLSSRLAPGDARMIGLPIQVGYPWSPMLFGLRDLRNVSALTVRRYLEYLEAISSKVGDFTLQSLPVTRSPLLDLAAVRYVVLPSRLPSNLVDAVLLTLAERPGETNPDLPVVFQDEHVIIHENRAALPRIRIVHRAEPLPDEDAAREWAKAVGARTERASDLGLAEMVVLEPDAHGNPAPSVAGRQSATESVRLVSDGDPDRLLIEARLDDAGFVVIADTFYPGWKAWVDGVPAQIYPANLLFRAVPVSAGAHTLDMRYQPDSFRYGLWLAIAAMFLCVIVILAPGSAREAVSEGALPKDEWQMGTSPSTELEAE